jgi:hypothetical protein
MIRTVPEVSSERESKIVARTGHSDRRTVTAAAGDGVTANAGGPRRPQQFSDGENEIAAGGCPSNTHLQGSQVIPFGPLEATFAIDWLEIAGCILWDDATSREQFWRLDQIQLAARETRKPQVVNIGMMEGLLHGQGMGGGQQSHLEYRFEWRDILFAISSRREPTRQLSNFYLKITGEPCLIVGAYEARKIIQEVITSLGGVIVDEWPRRIDVCLDLPGVSVTEELQPAFEQAQFLTVAKQWNSFDGREGKTGFKVGSRARLQCNVYDKLRDSMNNHNCVYHRAMIDRRWNGLIPKHATRVEYQMKRAWLSNYGGIRTVDEALSRMGDIVAKLVSHDHLPFFCLTTTKPDRANKHQSRAEVLPLWDRIVSTMIARAGDRMEELRPIKRNEITAKKAYQMVRGFLTTVASQWGYPVESLEDGIEVLKELYRRNDGIAADWELRWEAKARKAGTYDDIASFNFGSNQAI